MFDTFQEGFDKGKEDGFHSDSKNIRKHLHPIKALCSDSYVSSFGKGYNTGYKFGKKKYELRRTINQP